MSFDLSSLRTNQEAEQEGVWVPYLGGSKLKIARNGNAKYRAFVSMKYKQNRMAIDRGDQNADQLAEQINLEAMARFILLDWDGVELDGKAEKYTHELGMKCFKEIPDFRNDVDVFSNDTNLWRDGSREEDSENLKK